MADTANAQLPVKLCHYYVPRQFFRESPLRRGSQTPVFVSIGQSVRPEGDIIVHHHPDALMSLSRTATPLPPGLDAAVDSDNIGDAQALWSFEVRSAACDDELPWHNASSPELESTATPAEDRLVWDRDPSGDIHGLNGHSGVDTPAETACVSDAHCRRRLPKHAIVVMLAWITQPEHIDCPYPDDATKQRLAEASGISHHQVGVWFSNARKRQFRPSHPRGRNTLTTQSTPCDGRTYASRGFGAAGDDGRGCHCDRGSLSVHDGGGDCAASSGRPVKRTCRPHITDRANPLTQFRQKQAELLASKSLLQAELEELDRTAAALTRALQDRGGDDRLVSVKEEAASASASGSE